MMEPGESLSEREIEILRLVATGASNKEIATGLTISPNTVKVHLRNIFSKIGVVSRTEATLYAIKMGIVTQPGAADRGGTTDSSLPDATSPMALLDEERSTFHQVKSTNPRAPILSYVLILGVVLIAVLAAAPFLVRNFMVSPTNATLTPAPQVATIQPRWQIRVNIPAPSYAMASAIYNNSFFLIGGEAAGQVEGAVRIYDLSSGTWREGAEKPTPARDIQAALIAEKIYVPGGLGTGGNLLNVMEIYDPRYDVWATASPLPEKLSAAAVVAYEGDIYLFGGWNGQAYSRNVYRYDPVQNRWELRSEMPEARGLAAAAVQEGRILIIGGRSSLGDLDSVLAYYPNRDNEGETPWEDAPALPEPRAGLAAATLANSIYVVGGSVKPEAANQAGPSPLVLTPGATAWQPFETSAQAVGMQAALLPAGNYLHILGGKIGETYLDTHLAYQALYTVAIPLLSNDPSTLSATQTPQSGQP